MNSRIASIAVAIGVLLLAVWGLTSVYQGSDEQPVRNMETSLQAQFLIPLAVSIGYGVLFGTFIVVLCVPSFFIAQARVGMALTALVQMGGRLGTPDKRMHKYPSVRSTDTRETVSPIRDVAAE